MQLIYFICKYNRLLFKHYSKNVEVFCFALNFVIICLVKSKTFKSSEVKYFQLTFCYVFTSQSLSINCISFAKKQYCQLLKTSVVGLSIFQLSFPLFILEGPVSVIITRISLSSLSTNTLISTLLVIN